jgi:hypothetical protein
MGKGGTMAGGQKKKRAPGGGRKTKFEERMIKEGEKLAESGLVDEDIAKVWGVAKSTIHNWKKEYPLFFDSLKKGKEVSDAKVVQALFQRATGYTHPEMVISGGVRREVTKHYPPDPTSMIFWLCNRRRGEWQSINKTEINNIGVDVEKHFKKLADIIEKNDVK